VRLYEDPATISKVPALSRPAFGRIAAAAYPGDALTVSELFRLCRDLTDIQAVRDWCQARGVALRVLSGPLSNFADLAANDATTDLIVNVFIAVGQFQRDLQNELTAEGIAAAEAEGRYRGRPPAACPVCLVRGNTSFDSHLVVSQVVVTAINLSALCDSLRHHAGGRSQSTPPQPAASRSAAAAASAAPSRDTYAFVRGNVRSDV
jgi:DNA invertase Pin-like site-specific DNA recombinase